MKYINRKYRKGELYIVNEPMAKHYRSIIKITRIEQDYLLGSLTNDVYYQLLITNNDDKEYGFQLRSIFEQSLEPLLEENI